MVHFVSQIGLCPDALITISQHHNHRHLSHHATSPLSHRAPVSYAALLKEQRSGKFNTALFLFDCYSSPLADAALLYAPVLLEGQSAVRWPCIMSAYIHWPPQKITHSESTFMTQWSHYQALFIHNSPSSSDQNQVSRLGRFGILPHQCCHPVCVCVCAQGETDKQEQYDDAVNTSPSVGNAVSASACERETLPYGGFFTDEALFSCHPCQYGWLSGTSDWEDGQLLFFFYFKNPHHFLSPRSLARVLRSHIHH